MGRVRVRRRDGETLRLLLRLTNRHVHAQLVDKYAGRVVLAAHTTEPDVREALGAPSPAAPGAYATASVKAARMVGELFARRAVAAGVAEVFWQRPGRYHGKIRAFVDALRDGGVRTLRPPSDEMPPVRPLSPS
ncbi:unnamed protein product [Agarophyton chilense]